MRDINYNPSKTHATVAERIAYHDCEYTGEDADPYDCQHRLLTCDLHKDEKYDECNAIGCLVCAHNETLAERALDDEAEMLQERYASDRYETLYSE
jgi:hypothetical protein